MTTEEIRQNSNLLLEAINAADAAYEAFRVAKAKKFIALSFPTDGSKKPTETCIQALVDSDEAIAKLRVEADKKAAVAAVAKLQFQAETAAINYPRAYIPVSLG